MKEKIKIVANPILRLATILHNVNGISYNIELSFNDLDEWNAFETDAVYDIHFLYDEKFSVYVSKVNLNLIAGFLGDFDIDFDLIVVYNDYDYIKIINN
jgi:hypothetical protein